MQETEYIQEGSSGLNTVTGIQCGIDLISDKWTIKVIYALQDGPLRLGQLQRAVEGVSQKMLIQTLRELERNGLVTRTVFPVVPPKVEYCLTSLAETLIEPLLAIFAWTDKHLPDMEKARAHFDAQCNTD